MQAGSHNQSIMYNNHNNHGMQRAQNMMPVYRHQNSQARPVPAPGHSQRPMQVSISQSPGNAGQPVPQQQFNQMYFQQLQQNQINPLINTFICQPSMFQGQPQGNRQGYPVQPQTVFLNANPLYNNHQFPQQMQQQLMSYGVPPRQATHHPPIVTSSPSQPLQQTPPPSTQQQPQPQPTHSLPPQKKSKGIVIQDPDTMKDVTEEVLGISTHHEPESESAQSAPAASSTSDREVREIQSQFAAEVAKAAYRTEGNDVVDGSVETVRTSRTEHDIGDDNSSDHIVTSVEPEDTFVNAVSADESKVTSSVTEASIERDSLGDSVDSSISKGPEDKESVQETELPELTDASPSPALTTTLANTQVTPEMEQVREKPSPSPPVAAVPVIDTTQPVVPLEPVAVVPTPTEAGEVKENGETTPPQELDGKNNRKQKNRQKQEKREASKKPLEHGVNDADAVPTPVLVDVEAQPVEPASEQLNGAVQKDELPSTEAPTVNSTDNVSPVEDEEEAPLPKPTKYQYKEDQWSPLNPEGKRAYDRSFLLQFQDNPHSKKKPAGLPDLPEIIKDCPNVHRLPSEVSKASVKSPFQGGGGSDFLPPYMRGGMSGQQRVIPQAWGLDPSSCSVHDVFQDLLAAPAAAYPHTFLGGPPKRPSTGRKPPRVIQVPSLNKEVELHKAENAWKPAVQTADSNKDEIGDLNKKVRSILNKLTPQKFDVLVKQVQDLPIDTQKKLEGVIALVFEKAIDEPGFSVAYAKMCATLSHMAIPSDEQQGQPANFRKLLISRCQVEFEKDKTLDLNKKARLLEIDAIEDEEKKKEKKAEYEEDERKMRRRALGNIRFIGELYKLKMLTTNIMHQCLEKLISDSQDEEAIECLCRLLTTVGSEMEKEIMMTSQQRSKQKKSQEQIRDLTRYFEEMQQIVDRRLISSRVRFMLQDVIDLRASRWNPRREDNKPTTIDQVRKEAEQERLKEEMLNQQAAMSTPQGRRDNRDRDKKNRPDIWTPVQSSKFPKHQEKTDPSKKLKVYNFEEEIQLGPPRRNMNWGRGAIGATGGRVSQEEKSVENRYSLLSGNETGHPLDNRAPTRGSGGRGKYQQPAMASERESALAAVRNIGGEKPRSQVSSRESSLSRTKESKKLTLGGKPNISQEEVDKLTEPVLDEFLHHCDQEEAVLCVSERFHSTTVGMFVTACIERVLERSPQARHAVGELFRQLVKQNLLLSSQYVEGLGEMLSIAEDMIVDIPKFWDYIGELIAPIFKEEVLQLTVLNKFVDLVLQPSHREKFLCTVLHSSARELGEAFLREMWTKHNMDWSVFLQDQTNVDSFVRSNGLEFMVQSAVSPGTEKPPELTFDFLRVRIVDLLKKCDGGSNNDLVFDWIEKHVGTEKTGKEFIRALVTAVCENSIVGDGSLSSLNVEMLQKSTNLLTRYLDHKDDLELQALYAIQALVHRLEHPSTLLKQLFENLYDKEVISEDAFYAWEKSTDPAEQEGKGVAIKSVTQFMFWLKEAEEESS